MSNDVPDGAPGVGNGAGNDTGGSGSDSDVTWWGDVLGVPSALRNLGSSAKALLRNPRTWVIGVVIEWLVGGLLDFFGAALGVVLDAFGIAANAPLRLTAVGIQMFGQVGRMAVLSPLRGIMGLFESLAGVGGPVGALATGITLAVLIRVLAPLVPKLVGLVSPRIARALRLLSRLNPVRWFA